MKLIPLTKGQFAKVDDNDYEWLNQYKWCASWVICTKSYIAVRGNRPYRNVSMHRMIVNASKGAVVDHRNHDTLDNQRVNLRICTHSQNSMNRGKQSNNTSGFVGVYFEKKSGNWIARIVVKRKTFYLGAFHTPAEAGQAYLIAREKCFGEYAYDESISSASDPSHTA